LHCNIAYVFEEKEGKRARERERARERDEETARETHMPKTARLCKHCNTLQHIAIQCNTLEREAARKEHTARTATHCNTLQRTATH